MVLVILKHLEFCSNNEVHRPVIRALEVLKKYVDMPSTQAYFPRLKPFPWISFQKTGVPQSSKRRKTRARKNRKKSRSTASITSYACSKQCKKRCVVRSYGPKTPTASAIPMMMSQRTLRASARPTMTLSTNRRMSRSSSRNSSRT